MPQANSTTSVPRITSPSASESTLPCSIVIALASSLVFFSRRSLNLKSTRARRSGGVAAQAGKAAAAAATAASTSDGLASGTWALTSPVAGLNTSLARPEVPATRRPAIQWARVVGMGDLGGGEAGAAWEAGK